MRWIFTLAIATLSYAAVSSAHAKEINVMGRPPWAAVVCRDRDNDEWRREIAHEDETVKSNSWNAGALEKRGFAHMCLGELDSAISDFSQAISLSPNFDNAIGNRGMTYDFKGDLDHAIVDYSRFLELNPSSSPAYMNRANAYRRKGNNQAALADYDEAIRLRPDYSDAYVNRGEFYAILGDTTHALADFAEALARDSNNVNALINRGALYIRTRELTLAIADFNAVIKLQPDNAIGFHNRCSARWRTGQNLDQALADCNQDLRFRPNHPGTLEQRGAVYVLMKRYDEAIEDENAYLATTPDDHWALYVRGVARVRKGDLAGNADIAAAKLSADELKEFEVFGAGVTPGSTGSSR